MITTTTPGVTITPTINNLNSPTGLAFGQVGNVTFTVTGATPNTALCFDITLLGDSIGMPCCPYKWCCHKRICFTLPECKDCCKEFTKRIIKPTTTTNSAGQVTNTITVQAGAKPISKLTIQLVSSSIKVSCRPKVGAAETSAGWQTVSAIMQSPLPNPITPGLPLYSQTSYEGVWGINPSGVNLMSAPVTLSSFNLLFPPPPCNGYKNQTTCWDTIKYCLKISFTDSMCVTCDTTICYTIRRSGIPWYLCITDHKGPEPTDIHTNILTFKMKDDKTGNLNIALPSEIQENNITVRQICAQTTFGSHLTQFDGVNTRDFSGCSDKEMKSGETKDISLFVDNFSKLKRIGLVVTMFYSAAGSNETVVKVDTIYQSSPQDQGGDKMDETGDKTVKTRTYSLSFTNLNKSKGTISDVELRMPKGVHLLAFGSAFGDTINLGANANFKNDTVKIENYFVAEVCCRQDKNMASKKIGLSPNEAVKPIYITVSGAESGFDLSFVTTDSNGVVLSEGTLKLTNPLSTVKA